MYILSDGVAAKEKSQSKKQSNRKKSKDNTCDNSNVFYRLSDEDSVESLKNVLDRIGFKEGKENL